MPEWLWPLLGLAVIGGLLWLGARITSYKHEAMVALCLGEVFRLRGDDGRARRYYEAARGGKLRMPEADEAIAALDRGSREPVIDHPLVDDLERRLDEEPDELADWLASRDLPALGSSE